MSKALRLVHLWAGLALSLLLLVLAVTGSALVYKEAYWRLVYPELRGPAPELGPQDHAAAIAAARARYGERLRSVKMPEPGVAAYHLYLEGGEAFLATGTHHLIDEWRPRERAMALLFDVHAHLMAGEAGERVGGVAALLGAVLVATGLVLWWPARRRFRLGRAIVPRGLARRFILHWHRDLGVLAGPVLLVLFLTGAGVVFDTAAGRLLNGLLPARGLGAATVPAAASPGLPATASEGNGRLRAALLARVGAVVPDARLVFYYPPSAADPRHGFRLKRPCEIHPNGRSYAYLDAAGRLSGTTDACASAPGERTLHALYPLHSGKAGSELHKLVTFLGGLALAGLSASGTLSYVRKLKLV